MTKRALIVGVSTANPSGWTAPALSGVDDDCSNMLTVLRGHGFGEDEIRLFQDHNARRDSVLGELDAAKNSLSTGDFFVFVYSGHGGQRQDWSGDEDDGEDEAILTYDTEILDDDLANIWPRFAAGVRILSLTDCCHSGTIMRKANPGKGGRIAADPVLHGLSKARTRAAAPAGSGDDDSFVIQASMVHLSACRDKQLAADTSRGGALTRAFRESLASDNPGTYEKLHQCVQNRIPPNYRQDSEMHRYGPFRDEFAQQRPFDVNAPFPPGSLPWTEEQMETYKKALKRAENTFAPLLNKKKKKN